MPHARTLRPALLSLVVALAVGTFGCSDDDPATAPQPQPDPLPPGTPLNDTPTNTMIRFERAYENQVLGSYVALLAADFRFEFSIQADPILVSQFGNSWGVSNDSASTANLFDGFTNDLGDYVPGATGITLSFQNTQIIGDPDEPDSAAYYKLAVVPTASLLLDIPGMDGLEVAAPHNFHLVRGDAAVLRAGQPADSMRWYVRRQSDLSTSLAIRAPGPLAPSRVMPASPVTWGRIKATYL